MLAWATGCGGSDKSDDLEDQIQEELPFKEPLRPTDAEVNTIESVDCKKEDGNRYACTARGLRGVDPEPRDIPITATCDDEGCIWREE